MRTVKSAGIAFAAVLVATLALLLNPTREPRYAGKALSEWIDEYREAYAGVPRSSTPQHPNVGECGKAIRQIGSNAIPTLVAWAKDTTRFRHRGAYNRALAFWGFHILGEQAKGAFPALVQLTKSPQREVRENALSCLRELKLDESEAAAAFIPLLRDTDRNIRFYAAEALCDLPEDAQKAGVFDLFPGLGAVQPEASSPH